MLNIIELSNLDLPELEIYSSLKESQLKHRYEPEEGLFICESPKVILRALKAGYHPESLLLEKAFLEKFMNRQTSENQLFRLEIFPLQEAERQTGGSSTSNNSEKVISDILTRCRNIPIYTAPLNVLTKLTGFHLTGGMLCAMRRDAKLSMPDLFICKKIAVLEDIENPTNVGAIFRNAAALGIDAVLLTEGCSDPLYRRAARVSMGCVFQIPWCFLSSITVNSRLTDNVTQGKKPAEQLNISKNDSSLNICITTGGDALKKADVGKTYVDDLHELGFKTAAFALSGNSVSIDNPQLNNEKRLAIILGNENNGLLPETIAKSDYTITIPMAEGVDSLNVAAASAVAFWQLCRG